MSNESGRHLIQPDRDPRVYLAAERTFLAWIRTGLALMGFGFVVARFGIFLREMGSLPGAAPVRSSSFSVWIGTAIVLLGVVVNVVSTFEHVRTIRNLNAGREISGRPSTAGLALALLLAIVGLAMAAYLLFVR